VVLGGGAVSYERGTPVVRPRDERDAGGPSDSPHAVRSVPDAAFLRPHDVSESGPLRAVHLSRHKWLGGVRQLRSGRLGEST